MLSEEKINKLKKLRHSEYWKQTCEEWEISSWDVFYQRKYPETKEIERKSHSALASDLKVLFDNLKPKTKEGRKVSTLILLLKNLKNDENENVAPHNRDIVTTASSNKKRRRENHIITIKGPLHPRQGSLMLPVRERDFFKEIKLGFLEGQSYIIHGLYQSGKSTLLLDLKEILRRERLACEYIEMVNVKGFILTNKQEGFFNYMSQILFGETLNEVATYRRISKLEDPLYLLIDEFQYIFTDSTLCNVAKQFFQGIARSKVYYVAVGTFILADLMKSDKKLLSPFSRAKFEKMPLFSTKEMGRLFESYKFGINTNGVPYDLQVEIERASCGHPASFMILLRLFSDNLPTIGQWKKALHENLSKYINGTHITLKNEIDNMNTHERKYIRSLTEYMADRWEIDLNNLTDLDKKLLDIGILYLVDSNSVAFTSYIILRVCIDALFPSPSRPIPKKEVPDNPVDLLALGLSWINPTIVTDKRVQNKVGISERIMQASLFCVFNGILPRPMMCLLEMKGEGRTRLDLMIVDGDKNLVAYSLKCNKIASNDFEKPIDQAQMYAGHFDMGISLVNFFLSGHKPPSVLDNITEEIFIINIEYNSACTQFTITLQSDPDYSKVVDVKS